MSTEMEKWRDGYYKEMGTTYKNHVNKFVDYLKHIGKADMPNMVTLDDVRNCVGHYVKYGTLRAIGTMESHLESLKSFYDYLLKTGKSQDIFSQMNYEEFKNNLSIQFHLAEKIGRETFSVETMIDILSKLDNYLEVDYYKLNGTQVQNRYLNWTALSLFIKLTLVAPAKRQVIGNLRFSDFGEDLRSVVVNEIELAIPNSLRRDLKNAIELAKNIGNESIKADDEIFKFIIIGSNFSEESLNRWFCSFIKDQHIVGINEIDNEKDTYPVEPIQKTAISNMVKGKANLAYISKVSGIKIGRLEEAYHDEIFEIDQQQPPVSEAIDWEIRKSRYYSYI